MHNSNIQALFDSCCCESPSICCNTAPCGPFLRPLSDDYDSFSDNTEMQFYAKPECAPRNDSAQKGYLYKGLYWDIEGVRYWAIRNGTNNTITVEALDGGEVKDIPAGDVVNLNRGESYSFRVQAPAKLFELFNSEAHNIEIFINARGYVDYRAENIITPDLRASQQRPMNPKF
jgi:hypothetical protein